jgi:hypothetical protein
MSYNLHQYFYLVKGKEKRERFRTDPVSGLELDWDEQAVDGFQLHAQPETFCFQQPDKFLQ